ncbi:hypothetical protein [Candidatus Nitrosocosmicus arcticus]|uniref:Uncharacterized protein n=1 Tax=Candidatus Nitrosocosmicus arcticus TaxID=2035267 RepID=A0A557SZ76_9ARCH|nr:hypothetical protein [Candidatus Nitrosocosmicus arcticus]TVP41909.1 hypothetical protein NARC_10315 [Candidatus Nitrosocosmicus arcticus]
MSNAIYLKKGKKDDKPWYVNHPTYINKGLRIIDDMTYSEIYQMYDNEEFRCDTCGKPLKDEGELDIPVKDHINHLLNPQIIWSCMDCINEDFKKGRILMHT